jgi:hypothetical protein
MDAIDALPAIPNRRDIVTGVEVVKAVLLFSRKGFVKIVMNTRIGINILRKRNSEHSTIQNTFEQIMHQR